MPSGTLLNIPLVLSDNTCVEKLVVHSKSRAPTPKMAGEEIKSSESSDCLATAIKGSTHFRHFLSDQIDGTTKVTTIVIDLQLLNQIPKLITVIPPASDKHTSSNN